MKALTKKDLETYVSYLDKNLKGRHLSSPVLYTEKVFFFRLSGSPNNRFVIALDEEAPRLYMANEGASATSVGSHFFDQFKKELINPYIESVELVSEDRIVKMNLIVINNVFKEEKINLYLELFPHHPNMIITDKENKIILAYKQSNINDERPIVRGLIYETPKTNGFVAKESDFNPYVYEKNCLEEEESLAKKRKANKFLPIIRSLKNRKKLLERKLLSIDSDVEEAKKHLDDGQYGDAIYMVFDEIAPKATSVEYEGMAIKLDPSRNPSENAALYYKKAKKAKATIKAATENKERTLKELEDVTSSLTQLENADEAGLELLAKELDLYRDPKKKKSSDNWKGLGSDSLPYFIDYEGTKILYGKSSKQNDCLTFLYGTSKNHLWLHIMGDSGSHIIIKKDNPTEKEIRVACEIALINSHREDGEVMVALRKDVRKGNVPGQAVVKTFKTVRINKVSKETKDMVLKATKYRFQK
ncbi:MAG: NFACT family protein [Bacilli bacterium]|nr:NFACT family protein [Bacilli bacterium]